MPRSVGVHIASYLLFGVVAVAPIPFGSTDIGAIALWCILLGVAVCFSPLPELPARWLRLLFLPVSVTVAAYAFVLHEQLSGNPLIAPPNPLWADAARILNVPIAPSVSIARNQPFYSLGNTILCFLAVICGFLVGADEKRARRLVEIVAWSGGLLAIYGIVAYVVDPTHVLWRSKQAYHNVLTATFINRNTAAVYFGSCAVAWFALLSLSLKRRMGRRSLTWKYLLGDFLYALPPRIMLEFGAFLSCLAAMFMTASRAGTALSLLGLVVAFVVLFRDRLSTRSGMIVGLGSAALVTLALFQLMGAGVVGRLEIRGADEGGRFQTYLTTLRMIADYPWFGTGLGTYVWAHPAYRSPELPIWGTWDRAHSTPLELASDLGVPLATLVVFDWAIVLGLLLRGIVRRRQGIFVPLVAFCVSLIALLHSVFDFSMQIPGFAVIVCALAGAGVAQSVPMEKRQLNPMALRPESEIGR